MYMCTSNECRNCKDKLLLHITAAGEKLQSKRLVVHLTASLASYVALRAMMVCRHDNLLIPVCHAVLQGSRQPWPPAGME